MNLGDTIRSSPSRPSGSDGGVALLKERWGRRDKRE